MYSRPARHRWRSSPGRYSPADPSERISRPSDFRIIRLIVPCSKSNSARINAFSRVCSRTETVLGAVIAHATAHFSEIHSCLDVLLYHLGKEYSLEPVQHPSFLDGRAGRIVVAGRPVGVIGEVHPEVLERWQIGVPVVAFDVNLTTLSESK